MLWYETSDGSLIRLDAVIAVIIEDMDGFNGVVCHALMDGGKATIPLTLEEARYVKSQVQLVQMKHAIVRAERMVG